MAGKKTEEKKEAIKASQAHERPGQLHPSNEGKTVAAKADAKKAEPKKDASKASQGPAKQVLPKADAPFRGARSESVARGGMREEKKSRKVAVKKSREVLALRRKVLSKSGLPIFRGSFGQRIIRKKSIAKWDKWRVRRGIDVKNEIQDGKRPGQGYRRPRELRHVHPSGFREFVVRTLNDVNAVPKDHAIRIKAGVGKKKRIVIVDKAIEKGIKVLNP